MNAPIGVFDSGVGGLTVAREIMRQLPEESMIYFGDTARVPYGTKSKDTIVRYSRQIVNFLLSKGVKAVVIACNTASALALADLQELYNVPIIGMVQPGAIAAMNATKNKNIGIIGTNATIKSGQYGQYLRKLDPSVTVVTKACPLFVPLVEEGLIDDRITEDMVSRYLREFKQYDIDSLILGCTHYPLLINPIQRFVGDKVTLVNPAYEVAKTLKQMLAQRDMAASEDHTAKYEYYVSDMADQFLSFADKVLPCRVDQVQPVDMMTTGAYYLRNGKHYILYDELSEDNEIVKNVIKIGPKSVELTRKGGQSSHMVFEEGKENLSYYDTPFGSLLMGVNTSNIDWIEEEEQMHLKVDYDLSMNSDHVSKCKIDVNIRPNGE